MRKYIDRAALFNSLSNAKTVEEIFAAIQTAPAEDVEPVRRGRWINLKCNQCGQVDMSKPNYCPNCGARMEATE